MEDEFKERLEERELELINEFSQEKAALEARLESEKQDIVIKHESEKNLRLQEFTKEKDEMEAKFAEERANLTKRFGTVLSYSCGSKVAVLTDNF